jgi:hypothetical protein
MIAIDGAARRSTQRWARVAVVGQDLWLRRDRAREHRHGSTGRTARSKRRSRQADARYPHADGYDAPPASRLKAAPASRRARAVRCRAAVLDEATNAVDGMQPLDPRMLAESAAGGPSSW